MSFDNPAQCGKCGSSKSMCVCGSEREECRKCGCYLGDPEPENGDACECHAS